MCADMAMLGHMHAESFVHADVARPDTCMLAWQRPKQMNVDVADRDVARPKACKLLRQGPTSA